MDYLSNLQYANGAVKKVKRIGRGQGSGHGGTSTKGHKGQHSRAGANFKTWFEGGQMPLQRRIPKFGFTPPSKTVYQIINVSDLDKFIEKGKIVSEITPETLFKSGVIAKKSAPVKILGFGELKSKVNISAHAFSKSAIEKIEAAGGTTKTIE
jgi:large subunit ribosomal protein L15